MNIVRKSRGTELPKQAQRVFLCYNVHNSTGRDEIISNLLSMDAGMDCVVSYLESPDVSIDEKVLRNELLETQLLVVWVTLEMLQASTPDKLPIEYSVAKELHIPILPILSDNGLFSLYNEKFGSIHCINMSDNEYRVKLTTQMETFLASDEIIKQVREKAFTAVVFASYRKHELSEARRFMKAFHDLEGFESISIWYDNFLIAGRDFDKDIEESITKSNALILAVTPDLATEDNYVQRREYPFAQKIGKSVVSVEIIPTSKTQFFKLFPNTECPIPLDDAISLRAAFRDKLGESAFAKELDSECAYLLGMAYFKGIDVERDFDRAVRLLSIATEDNTTASIDAADLLAIIYENDTGININYNKALEWYQKALSIREKILGYKHPDTATTCNNIALVYSRRGDFTKALEWYQKALVIQKKILGEEHHDIAKTYNSIGKIYSRQDNYSKAQEWYQKAFSIQEKTLDKELPDIARTCNNIGRVYSHLKDYSNALEWHQKALVIHEKTFGKEHPDTARTYNSFGRAYSCQGDYQKALEWHQKALSIREKVLGKEHPSTATTCSNIAAVYFSQGDYLKAQEWYQKVLVIREKMLGKEHQSTAVTYDNIAAVYDNQKDYSRALEWYQKALAIFEKKFDDKHPYIITINNAIVNIHKKQEIEGRRIL